MAGTELAGYIVNAEVVEYIKILSRCSKYIEAILLVVYTASDELLEYIINAGLV